MWHISIVLLMCLVAGYAYSNPPSPTPPESKKQEKAKAGERERESSKDKRGTQDSPVIVEVLPAKNAEEIARQQRDHEHNKAFYDGLIAWSTVALAMITFFLALFTAKLWNATKTLAKDAKDTATKQAADMQASLAIAKQSADAAEQSVALARQEFIATHRPRLVVRRISHVEEDGEAIGVLYTVHNVGDSDCTIIAVSESVWLPPSGSQLPPIPPYSFPVAKDIPLKCGDWVPITHTPPEAVRVNVGFATGFQESMLDNPHFPPTSTILFMGYIDYVDKLGRKRQTAFLRQLDFMTKRFNPINHPEYEYQD